MTRERVVLLVVSVSCVLFRIIILASTILVLTANNKIFFSNTARPSSLQYKTDLVL